MNLTIPLKRLFLRETPSKAQRLGKEPAVEPLIKLKPVRCVEMKVSEFASFIEASLKFAPYEIIAVGIGEYCEEEGKISITSIYPVLFASNTLASVKLDVRNHEKLDTILGEWGLRDETAVIHSHPGFGVSPSSIDLNEGIRAAAILFDGAAAMIIVDPMARSGISVGAYAIDPETKKVREIAFKLVP